MKNKYKSVNKVDLCGTVVYFKEFDFKTFKKATIGVKDNNLDSVCYFDIFQNNGLKYNKQKTTLATLKKKFMDSDGKMLNTRIHCYGSIEENHYTTRNGEVRTDQKPIVFNIFEALGTDDYNIFRLDGIVDLIKPIKDGKELKVRLKQVVGKWDKNIGEETRVLKTIDLIAEDEEIIDKLDGLDNGEYVSLEGYFINQISKSTSHFTKAGSEGTSKNKHGMYIKNIVKFNENFDSDKYFNIEKSESTPHKDNPIDTSNISNISNIRKNTEDDIDMDDLDF